VRRLLLISLAVAACSLVAGPALASVISAQTGPPQNVTTSSATLQGGGQTSDGSPVTYHFEYGKTTAYGASTPAGQAPSQTFVQANVGGLTAGTTYHYRFVAQDASGDVRFGNDVAFTTVAGPPPHQTPAGATTTSETVGPGGSFSTGSDPSSARPVVMKVTAEKGGEFYIDEIKNPARPGADPEAEDNPEDPGASKKRWYGPAYRLEPPATSQLITVVFTIDHDADELDGFWRNQGRSGHGNTSIEIQADSGKRACIDDYNTRLSGLHYLANDDVQVTRKFKCSPGSAGPMTFHFYNRAWGLSDEATRPAYNTSLTTVLQQRYLETTVSCYLKCSKSARTTISSSTAKALRLDSSTLGKASKGPSATLKDEVEAARKGAVLKLQLSRKVRRALKRANRITVSFHMKAVGPDGQVWKQTMKVTFKKDEDSSDSIG